MSLNIVPSAHEYAGLSAELVLLVGAVTSIIFSTAGIIFILENKHFNDGGKFDNLFECIYYVVIVSDTLLMDILVLILFIIVIVP